MTGRRARTLASTHLNLDQLSELAEQALGLVTDSQVGGLEARAFAHLATCDLCQELLGDMSALLAGEVRWEPASLTGYRAVAFSPCALPEALQSPEPTERLAADDDDGQLGLAAVIRQRLLSDDRQVDLLVYENFEDDSCFLFPHAIGTVDQSKVFFYLPPGMIRPWPDSGFFKFPRYTCDAVDWTRVKLLYPAESDGEETS